MNHKITISSGNFISDLAIALIVLKFCGVITYSWAIVLLPCILAALFLLIVSLIYLNTFKKTILKESCNCYKNNFNPMYNKDSIALTGSIFKEKEVKNETSRKSRSTKRKSKESDSRDKKEEPSK